MSMEKIMIAMYLLLGLFEDDSVCSSLLKLGYDVWITEREL